MSSVDTNPHARDVRPGQAWTNGVDRFLIVGRLTDDIGWAVSRGRPAIDRILDEQLDGYELDARQPDEAP